MIGHAGFDAASGKHEVTYNAEDSSSSAEDTEELWLAAEFLHYGATPPTPGSKPIGHLPKRATASEPLHENSMRGNPAADPSSKHTPDASERPSSNSKLQSMGKKQVLPEAAKGKRGQLELSWLSDTAEQESGASGKESSPGKPASELESSEARRDPGPQPSNATSSGSTLDAEDLPAGKEQALAQSRQHVSNEAATEAGMATSTSHSPAQATRSKKQHAEAICQQHAKCNRAPASESGSQASTQAASRAASRQSCKQREAAQQLPARTAHACTESSDPDEAGVHSSKSEQNALQEKRAEGLGTYPVRAKPDPSERLASQLNGIEDITESNKSSAHALDAVIHVARNEPAEASRVSNATAGAKLQRPPVLQPLQPAVRQAQRPSTEQIDAPNEAAGSKAADEHAVAHVEAGDGRALRTAVVPELAGAGLMSTFSQDLGVLQPAGQCPPKPSGKKCSPPVAGLGLKKPSGITKMKRLQQAAALGCSKQLDGVTASKQMLLDGPCQCPASGVQPAERSKAASGQVPAAKPSHREPPFGSHSADLVIVPPQHMQKKFLLPGKSPGKGSDQAHVHSGNPGLQAESQHSQHSDSTITLPGPAKPAGSHSSIDTAQTWTQGRPPSVQPPANHSIPVVKLHHNKATCKAQMSAVQNHAVCKTADEGAGALGYDDRQSGTAGRPTSANRQAKATITAKVIPAQAANATPAPAAASAAGAAGIKAAAGSCHAASLGKIAGLPASLAPPATHRVNLGEHGPTPKAAECKRRVQSSSLRVTLPQYGTGKHLPSSSLPPSLLLFLS